MDADFQQLLDAHWQTRLELDPFLATYLGDHRYDHLLPVISEAAFGRQMAIWQGYQRRWQEIEVTSLSAANQLNYTLI